MSVPEEDLSWLSEEEPSNDTSWVRSSATEKSEDPESNDSEIVGDNTIEHLNMKVRIICEYFQGKYQISLETFLLGKSVANETYEISLDPNDREFARAVFERILENQVNVAQTILDMNKKRKKAGEEPVIDDERSIIRKFFYHLFGFNWWK